MLLIAYPTLSRAHLQPLGALRVEKVPDLLLVDLKVRHSHQKHAVRRLAHQVKQIARRHLDDPGSLGVLPVPLHSECLARGSLTVREDGAVQAANDGVHDLLRDALVHLPSGAVLVKDAVVREERVALTDRKRVAFGRGLLVVLSARKIAIL